MNLTYFEKSFLLGISNPQEKKTNQLKNLIHMLYVYFIHYYRKWRWIPIGNGRMICCVIM